MSAEKYKVGDKVLIRDDLESGMYYDFVYFCYEMKRYCNKVMTIDKVYEDCNGCYKMKKEDYAKDYHRWSFNDEMIVGKVEEDVEFTKNNLKTGMICTDRSGREWLVLRDIASLDRRSDIMIYKGGWNPLADINKDLTSTFEESYDIVKVEVGYGFDIEEVLTNGSKGKREIVWERDSKLTEAKKLLAEYYGKPVENIVVVVQ